MGGLKIKEVSHMSHLSIINKLWRRYDRIQEPWRFVTALVISMVGIGSLALPWFWLNVFGVCYLMILLYSLMRARRNYGQTTED